MKLTTLIPKGLNINSKAEALNNSDFKDVCLDSFSRLYCSCLYNLHVLRPVQSLLPSELVLTPPLLCGLVPPSGKQRNAQEAMTFIHNMYKQRSVCAETKESKNVYTHFTCATDTSNIRKVFNDVKDTVLIKSLKEYGVLWAAHRFCRPNKLSLDGCAVDGLNRFSLCHFYEAFRFFVFCCMYSYIPTFW